MINEERKSMGGDEYQYPNEEYVAETTPAEEKEVPPKRANFIVRLAQNNKRVTAVVLIVVVALVVFKLLSLRNHDKVIAMPKPVVAEQVAAPVVTSPSPQLLNQLSSLKQDAQNNQLTVNQLQNQIQDLHNSLNQSTSAQAQLNQSMVALTEQVKQLEQVVAATAKPTGPAKKVAPLPAPIVFHLRAIVPGRAWIVSSDGLSESIAQGDSVPQYGTVQIVDANRGMVLTSSGKVIGYGDNDH
jgi:intracellular multiplication protein IcmG